MKKPNVRMDVVEKKIAALPMAYKAGILLGVMALIGVAFYFLSYKPQAQRIRGLERKVTQQQKRLEELKRAAREVKQLQAELVEAEKKLQELLTLLPDQKEIPGLLENVTRLGAEEGLENLLFQPQGEQRSEFYASIPVRLDLVGTYHELGQFFDKISRLDRILKVQNLNIGRSGGQSSDIKVNFTLYTYRFLKEEAMKKSDEEGKGKKKKK